MTDLEALQRAINEELYKIPSGSSYGQGDTRVDRITSLLYLRDIVCKAQNIRAAESESDEHA